jgi:hypothetical protein
LERIAAEDADPLEIGMAGQWRVVTIMGPDADGGDAQRAYETATRLVEAARPRANPYELTTVNVALLQACAVGGRREEAQAAYWQARRWADQINNTFAVGQSLYALSALASGPIETLELLHEAITVHRGVEWTNLGLDLILALINLARVDCTETVATACSAWRKWYPHGTIRYLDRDHADLERSL